MQTKVMFWIEARALVGAGHPSLPSRMQWRRLWGNEDFNRIVADFADCRNKEPDQVFRLVQIIENVLDETGAYMDIWIGRERDIRAMNKGKARPRIVQRAEQLMGLRGPLRMNLVGDVRRLVTWLDLRNEIHRLHGLGVITQVIRYDANGVQFDK